MQLSHQKESMYAHSECIIVSAFGVHICKLSTNKPGKVRNMKDNQLLASPIASYL